MSDSKPSPEQQALSPGAAFLVVFDAPDLLKRHFLENGFVRHGRQQGAWHRLFSDPTAHTPRNLEYELRGVGLAPRWWAPA